MVRMKHRYFLLEIIPDVLVETGHDSNVVINDNDIYLSIVNAVSILHGDFGSAAIVKGLKATYINRSTRIVIVRSSRGPHQFVATALPLISKIGKCKASFRLLHLGGTIRSCNKFLLNHNRRELLKTYKMCTNPAQKQQLTDLFSKYSVTSNWTF